MDYDKFWSPAFDNMGDSVLLLDKDYNLIKVNKSFAKFTEKSEEYLIGKKCYAVVHGSEEPFKECPHRRMLRSKVFESSEFFEPHLQKWLSMSATPVFDEVGRLAGSIHIAADITERKRVGEEVEKVKEYTENIVSSMVDALIVLSPDGTIQTVNKATCALLGFEEKSLLGQGVGIIFAEEEEEEEEEVRTLVEKRFRKLVRKGPILGFEALFKAKGGEKIPVSISGSVMRDEKGKLIGVVLAARDMRAKIAAEAALKESEERYRGVVENLTDAIYLLDEKGRFVHMNRPGLELNGFKKDVTGRSFLASSHKKYKSILTKGVETAWSGKAIDFHYESTTAGGAHKWWDCSLVPFRDAEGKIVNIIGISRDITEHRRAEKLIKFFREYAENIVANLPVSVLVINRDLDVSFVNRHFLRNMRMAKDKVVEKSLGEVLGKAFVQNLRLDEMVKRTIKDEKEARGNFELRYRTYDYRILPFKERMGRRKNAMIIMEDVTERVQLEEQLRHSEKMSAVGQFTAGVVHEINNPLSIIVGNVQYMLSNMDRADFTDREQVEKLAETLEVVEGEACRCAEIVTNLLHFSYKGEVEKGEVNINKVIRRTMQMLEHQLRLSKIESTVELERGLPPVNGDAGRIQQVFVNLVLNAQHAMSGGGKLFVKTFTEDSGWINISIRDNGPGIPKKHLHRVFEPFYTSKRAGEGTGLGLSVVHSIIEDHGGTVEVESKRGKGAAFIIKLPALKKGLFGLLK